MTLPARIETAIIGAGHAGLIMSSLRTQAGKEHLIVERAEAAGGSWRERWDSFRLVTPNWLASFPGYEYDGPDRDGFMARDERTPGWRLRRTHSRTCLPQHGGSSPRAAHGSGFLLETTQGELAADEVVVATGSFHEPRIPVFASSLPARIEQVHSQAYRNERHDVP